MKISFLAFVTFLSASSPSADIFVESASFRGLMSKLSSRTTTANDNNNNNNDQDATTTIDEVVHVDLDQHAIALAETTDVHPHLAASDPEQGVRHLSCVETFDAPLRSCCTEKAWVRGRLDQWILSIRRRLQLPIVLVRGCMLQPCIRRTGQWSVFQFVTQSTHGQSNRLGRGCVLSRLLHRLG